MKRSKVNREIAFSKALLEKNNIKLPEYAYWTLDQWKANKDKIGTIKKVMLGWDVSDYGLDRFEEVGGVLYTVRNGDLSDASVGVPYCEKYLFFREGQYLPKHYHVWKTEDIINRAGGVIELFLWNTDADGKQLDTDVTVKMDGIAHTFKAGESILIHQGGSVTLEPHMAHVFGAKPGCGELIAGEVSKVNDDNTDNYFLDGVPRFVPIEEDEAIVHPLCNEYDQVL